MSVTAADLKALYDEIVALSAPVYWLRARVTDSGDLSVPDDADYYVLDIVTDPSVRDFSGEAYSVSGVFLSVWATEMGREFALLSVAEAAAEGIGWRATSRATLPREVRRFGLRTLLIKEH
jgi:hypothetical protein